MANSNMTLSALALPSPSLPVPSKLSAVKDFFGRFVPGLLGIASFIALGFLLSALSPGLPTPLEVGHEAIRLFSDPFYVNTPNDQGIGWNILASFARVGVGFGFAALIGIPLGIVLGRWETADRFCAPVIAILRPVSPLAWLPIGLYIFKSAYPASIYVIFVSSIWPIILNTATGIKEIPKDYLNLARVLQLSEWRIFKSIVLPATMPYIITGIRLGLGVAWLVIVAAEMLTGGVGLGFWIWDEWNNLNLAHIMLAIVVVGIVGYLLESSLLWLGRRLRTSET